MASAIVGLILWLGVVGALIWMAQKGRVLDDQVQLLRAIVARLSDDLDLARTPENTGSPHAPGSIDLEVWRSRTQGVAPSMSGYIPVDPTIPTSAHLPADEPGDRDQMEVEVEDRTPLSPEPPGR